MTRAFASRVERLPDALRSKLGTVRGERLKSLAVSLHPTAQREFERLLVDISKATTAGQLAIYSGRLDLLASKNAITQKQAVGDAGELRKVLAMKGVAATEKQFKQIILFVTMSLKAIQYKRKAELMRMQFGWADNDTKFIIGDREICFDGIFHSPPSSTTRDWATHLHVEGSYEKWQEVINLYGRPGLEPHAFAVLTAFGAPLFKFTGQSGAIINVIHPTSGTGKTTLLHATNSIYGHPKDLCAIKGDTANAKTQQLGVFNNLPFCVDEITNMTGAGLSEMSYKMSQGRGKHRMKATAN